MPLGVRRRQRSRKLGGAKLEERRIWVEKTMNRIAWPRQSLVLGLMLLAPACGESAVGDPPVDAVDGGGESDAAQDAAPPTTPTERAESHRFPKLFNQYQSCCRTPESEADFDALHYWDLVTVDAEILEHMQEYLGRAGLFRTRNPNIIVTTYFSSFDEEPLELGLFQIFAEFNAGLHPDWILQDTSKMPIKLFNFSPGIWSHAMNQSVDGLNDYMAQYVLAKLVSVYPIDGIWYDWGANSNFAWLSNTNGNGPIDVDLDGVADPADFVDSELRDGLARLHTVSRQIFPPDLVILGNAGRNSDADFLSTLNGVELEGFGTMYPGDGPNFTWSARMRTYAAYASGALEPRLTHLLAVADQQNDYTFLRFTLTSALMFDGYFGFTSSPVYAATWWYDEYSVDLGSGKAIKDLQFKGYLGNATGAAYNAENPAEHLDDRLAQGDQSAESAVWRRDFEHGVALVNPTNSPRTVSLGGTFRRILGTVDPAFNDGASVTSQDLPPLGGAILLW